MPILMPSGAKHQCAPRASALIAQRLGGDVEKVVGDAIMATFNSRGDQAKLSEPSRGGSSLSRYDLAP
jgi:hypothetical protein